MEYIMIPTKDKTETAFFMNLMKKMHKKASKLTTENMEDIEFIAAMKESEKSVKGSLEKVKAHLTKVASGK